jgi:hypothetical protein
LKSRLLAGAAAVALPLLFTLGGVGRAAAAPPDRALLPLDQYTSEKGRELGRKYAEELRALASGIYYCIPWLEVQEHSLGFYRPKHLGAGDSRYLSMRVFIEQDASPDFAQLTVANQAAAMYARYVAALLKRMARSQALTADPGVEGFTIILEWLKQSARAASDRPIHETVAVFIDKASALDFLAGRIAPRALADRAQIRLWDGETSLENLRLTRLAEDDFVSTYKMKNYQPDPRVTCP